MPGPPVVRPMSSIPGDLPVGVAPRRAARPRRRDRLVHATPNSTNTSESDLISQNVRCEFRRQQPCRVARRSRIQNGFVELGDGHRPSGSEQGAGDRSPHGDLAHAPNVGAVVARSDLSRQGGAQPASDVLFHLGTNSITSRREWRHGRCDSIHAIRPEVKHIRSGGAGRIQAASVSLRVVRGRAASEVGDCDAAP